MRRAGRIGLIVLAVLVLLPLLAVAVVLVGLNTGPGQRLVERLTPQLTGGMVVLAGVGGRFPDAPRIRHLEVRDAAGTWLTLDDVLLDWSPTRLLAGDASIDHLSARRIALDRLPVSQPSASPSTGGSFSLPVRVDVAALDAGRIEVGAPLAGTAAVLALNGTLHLVTLTEGSGELHLRRLDGTGTYDGSGQVDATRLVAKLAVAEPANGLLASLVHLPDLGPLAAQVAVDGPWSATAVHLTLAAGLLRATAQGSVDVTHQAADLDVSAQAPAMTPAAGVSWQSVALDAHVHGPFVKPDATATLEIRALAAGGAALRHASLQLAGNAGHVGLQATLEGLVIPGPSPDLLAGTPVAVQADMQLDDPARPVTFSLRHPLLQLVGQARTAAPMTVQATLTLPDLHTLAAAGGVDLAGHAALGLKAALSGDVTTLEIDSGISITGGMAPVPGLLGDATLGVSAAVQGQDVTLSRLELDGAAIRLAANGGFSGGQIRLDWQVALERLAVLAPGLAGSAQAHGTVSGPAQDFAAGADLAAEFALPGMPRSAVTASLSASGLPGAPAGRITASGGLAGAPLALALGVQRTADGALALAIDRADWKSAHAEGALQLAAGATIPTGHVLVRMASLADLRPLVGQEIAGQVHAEADLSDPRMARLSLDVTSLAAAGARVGRASLAGTLRDPTGHPVVDARLAVTGVAAGGIGGQAQLQVGGPLQALALRLNAALTGVAGADATVAAAATVDGVARSVLLASTQVQWKGETLRLLAPVRVTVSDGVVIDRLRLGLRQAELSLAGRVSPTLDVTASLSHVTADLARVVLPSLQADGSLQAQARLTGTPARPEGTVTAAATGLHLRSGPGRALPAADIALTATLSGRSARLDARFAAGANRLAVTGQAPLDAAGPLDLRAAGGIDLALLDPILAASGRRVRGQLALDATATGTLAAPALAGTLRLAHGEVQDFALGVHLTNIEARLRAAGTTVQIETFTATAGPGTLSLAGSIGALAPGIPLDIRITARNARPLASDLLTATLDADLTLRGQAAAQLALAGTVHISSANIQIPEQLPGSVAVLNVRVAGQQPPPPAPPPDITLDLTVSAPRGIFVRGHGLDAEMSGDLHAGGTVANPQLTRGFQLVRGIFSLAGVTLTFTSGDVSFNGAGRLDPSIDFVATSANSSSVTATLTISGYADAPKITLSSVPDLPQDEVLAHLLFNQSVSSLSPFQLAEIAVALAQIGGVAPATGDPLGRLRSGLGLDQLNVGSSSTGAPTLNAGRYVAPGVYVGAKQGLSNGGTQATVQIDIAKGLKLDTDVGSGQGANSVGLTYQFDY